MRTNIIHGKFVNLRIADVDDAKYTLTIRQSDNNTKHMPKLDVDLSTQKRWIEEQINSRDCYFFVVERTTGEKIGTFSLYNIKKTTGETGRLILRGNQIETLETCLLFHDFCFGEAGMTELFSEIEEGNTAAIGLAQRLGAKLIDDTSDSQKEKKMIKMSATKEEYILKREALEKIFERFVGR